MKMLKFILTKKELENVKKFFNKINLYDNEHVLLDVQTNFKNKLNIVYEIGSRQYLTKKIKEDC